MTRDPEKSRENDPKGKGKKKRNKLDSRPPKALFAKSLGKSNIQNQEKLTQPKQMQRTGIPKKRATPKEKKRNDR